MDVDVQSRTSWPLASQDAPVPPGEWTAFSLDQDVTRLKFAVIAKASSGRETSLTVGVRSGDKSETRRIPLRLPAPDVVDLVVHQIGGAVGAADRGHGELPAAALPQSRSTSIALRW